jgi:hypothetical protein
MEYLFGEYQLQTYNLVGYSLNLEGTVPVATAREAKQRQTPKKVRYSFLITKLPT